MPVGVRDGVERRGGAGGRRDGVPGGRRLHSDVPASFQHKHHPLGQLLLARVRRVVAVVHRLGHQRHRRVHRAAGADPRTAPFEHVPAGVRQPESGKHQRHQSEEHEDLERVLAQAVLDDALGVVLAVVRVGQPAEAHQAAPIPDASPQGALARLLVGPTGGGGVDVETRRSAGGDARESLGVGRDRVRARPGGGRLAALPEVEGVSGAAQHGHDRRRVRHVERRVARQAGLADMGFTTGGRDRGGPRGAARLAGEKLGRDRARDLPMRHLAQKRLPWRSGARRAALWPNVHGGSAGQSFVVVHVGAVTGMGVFVQVLVVGLLRGHVGHVRVRDCVWVRDCVGVRCVVRGAILLQGVIHVRGGARVRYGGGAQRVAGGDGRGTREHVGGRRLARHGLGQAGVVHAEADGLLRLLLGALVRRLADLDDGGGRLLARVRRDEEEGLGPVPPHKLDVEPRLVLRVQLDVLDLDRRVRPVVVHQRLARDLQLAAVLAAVPRVNVHPSHGRRAPA
mmetsp:Transcript_36279/g.116507  ORF Transcript_36279/g.116507 Transcript_36279/m.116507 type:complete len:510 (-) Transcript_36279:81-1610(-)|eukprot:scaffold9101_cov133-Isochrysis_galbana.AAC.1